MQLLLSYCALITIFYEKTDGFNEEMRLRYSALKTLPILALALSVHFGWGSVKCTRRHLLVIALLAGACDFLISICRDMELSFALSSIVFGIAHIFYMAGFFPHVKSLSPELTLGAMFYAILMNYFFLWPNFGSHPFTTLTLMAYSAVLGVALILSGSLALQGTRWQPPRQKNNILRFVGYFLFFVSDTFLLLEHAGVEFPCCKEVLILSTYYSAQYLIMKGAVETEQLI